MSADASETELDARSVASLAALRRLSLGAAHSLNNAFTSAIGEATYLLDERKEDAELVECCQLILAALERSTRITRGLLARRDSIASDDETDLGHLLKELASFLAETLGRSHPLDISVPAEWIGVKADPTDIDLILTTLLHYAADASGDQTRLAACLERAGGDARLTISATGCSSAGRAVDGLNDPLLAENPVSRASLRAVRELLTNAGASLHAESTAPDAWAFVLVFPAL